MVVHKPQRTVYAPIRQLAITIAIASVIFLVTQLPVLQLSASSINLSAKYTNSDSPNATDQPTPEHKPDSDLVSQPETDQGETDHGADRCLRYIFYDKPVKTGSTAITQALGRYLNNISDPAIPCVGMEDCTRISEQVCTGERPRRHLIQHVFFNSTMTACLRNKGFYHVTSIREPKQRIISAWRFSLTRKANHYGIPYNATFSEFLQRFPRCSLYSYYDLLPARCTMQQAEQRAQEIASRFDEIIDLSHDPLGDVHRRILPFLKDVNVAPSGRAKTGELEVPDQVVELEYVLYDKLREKRLSLAKTQRKVLCER